MAAIAAKHYADTSATPYTTPAAKGQTLAAFEARVNPLHLAHAAAAGAPTVSEGEVR